MSAPLSNPSPPSPSSASSETALISKPPGLMLLKIPIGAIKNKSPSPHSQSQPQLHSPSNNSLNNEEPTGKDPLPLNNDCATASQPAPAAPTSFFSAKKFAFNLNLKQQVLGGGGSPRPGSSNKSSRSSRSSSAPPSTSSASSRRSSTNSANPSSSSPNVMAPSTTATTTNIATATASTNTNTNTNTETSCVPSSMLLTLPAAGSRESRDLTKLPFGRALVVSSGTSADPSPTPRSSRGGSTSSRSPHPMLIRDIIEWETTAINRGMSRDEIRRVKLEWYRKVCSRIDEYLFLGGDTVARTQEQLQDFGITHILNVAGTACRDYFPTSFQYMTLDLFDGVQQDIVPYFFDAIEFIENARQNRGKVFVHCHQGVSRSSSFVIGYLMWRNGERFETVLDRVKAIRSISSPNDGFTGRLLMWQRNLTERRNRLYYMTLIPNNSERFLNIVPIECENVSVAALDPRTCFVLRTVDNEVFLWRGSRCSDERILAAGRRFAKQLERFFNTKPLSCELFEQQMEISSPTSSTESIPSGECNGDSMSRFWQFLGVSSQPSEPIEEKTTLYPYLSQLYALLEGRPKSLSSPLPNPLPDPVSEEAQPDPMPHEAPLKPKCRLYEFPHLDSLGSWDDIDLNDHCDGRFGLLCHYGNSHDRHAKSTAPQSGECYIWVGSDLAESLDEEFERSQAQRLIREKGDLPPELYKIFIEVQDEESEKFWDCFDTNGY